jgi:hypothetical protein
MKLICEYFLKCTNKATCLVPHPILTVVAACDRCAKLAEHDPDELPRILEIKKDGQIVVDKELTA